MNSSTNATKRWWYIMPIVFITYSPAYLDRANFSFASAAGITEDLGHHQGDLLPSGGAVLPRLLLLPDPRRYLCGAPQRSQTDLYLPDPVGRLRLP